MLSYWWLPVALARLLTSCSALPAPTICTNWLGSTVPCAHTSSPDFFLSQIRNLGMLGWLPGFELSTEKEKDELNPQTEKKQEGEEADEEKKTLQQTSLDGEEPQLFEEQQTKIKGYKQYERLKASGYYKSDDDYDSKFSSPEEENENAILKFQDFNNLEPTGRLDEATVDLLNTPRCGFEDQFALFEEFNLEGSKWEKRHLTYTVTKYTEKISRKELDREIRKAFDIWEEASSLTFTRIKNPAKADIKISFVRGKHVDYGDRFPLDGSSKKGGTTLAHAFFPKGQYIGLAHFDEDENWSVTPNVGNQVLNTLTHEFGHNLGLKHSKVRGAIMAPYYKGWDVNLALHQDDIDGVQELYGPNPRKLKQSSGNNPASQTEDDGTICSKLDAIFATADGTTYVFRGSEYWRLTKTGVASGFPRQISRDWPGLPDNIQAAITWDERKATYFFKGDQFWRFKDQTPAPGYPKSIKAFPGLEADIDAAFQWNRTSDLYFLKGDKYWRYDVAGRKMAAGYPRLLSQGWQGVPHDVEGAVLWHDRTYFFKGGQYWQLNDQRISVNQTEFPRPVRPSAWFTRGCGQETLEVWEEKEDLRYSATPPVPDRDVNRQLP